MTTWIQLHGKQQEVKTLCNAFLMRYYDLHEEENRALPTSYNIRALGFRPWSIRFVVPELQEGMVRLLCGVPGKSPLYPNVLYRVSNDETGERHITIAVTELGEEPLSNYDEAEDPFIALCKKYGRA